MTLETRIVRQAISRLQEDGYVLVSCHDGENRYEAPQDTTPRAALNAAMDAALGTDYARFNLSKGEGNHCSILAVWGNGEDVISDCSANTEEEMDRIEDLILA